MATAQSVPFQIHGDVVAHCIILAEEQGKVTVEVVEGPSEYIGTTLKLSPTARCGAVTKTSKEIGRAHV